MLFDQWEKSYLNYSLAACGDFIIHSLLEKSREINE